jgi:hypothetical protein
MVPASSVILRSKSLRTLFDRLCSNLKSLASCSDLEIKKLDGVFGMVYSARSINAWADLEHDVVNRKDLRSII